MAEDQVVCEKTTKKGFFDIEELDLTSFSGAEIFGLSSSSNFASDTTDELDEANATSDDNSSSDQKKSDFYTKYIEKYYPKAYVIREKFLQMNINEVSVSINEIIDLITKIPWFYFQNSPKRFRLIYFWELIIDQLAILHDFFTNARLDKKTKKIFWPANKSKSNYWSNFSNVDEDKNSIAVGDYLKENYVKVYADFYALAFDYHNKMFNEGIYLKDLSKANKYIGELEYILEKLKNTPHEANYTSHLKVYKEVLAILRKKNGAADYANFNGFMNSSNEDALSEGIG